MTIFRVIDVSFAHMHLSSLCVKEITCGNVIKKIRSFKAVDPLTPAELQVLVRNVPSLQSRGEETIDKIITVLKERNINGEEFRDLDDLSFTEEHPELQKEIKYTLTCTREYIQTLTKSSEFGAARKVRLHRPSQFT